MSGPGRISVFDEFRLNHVIVRDWCSTCEAEFYRLFSAVSYAYGQTLCKECDSHRLSEKKRKRRLLSRTEPDATKCDHCGKEFTPRSHATRTRHCSNACRQWAYRECRRVA